MTDIARRLIACPWWIGYHDPDLEDPATRGAIESLLHEQGACLSAHIGGRTACRVTYQARVWSAESGVQYAAPIGTWQEALADALDMMEKR
jgi:hypothetical protein